MVKEDYISTGKAREELGEDYFILKRWMREKGIDNLTQVGDKYVNEIFITKRQLNQFVREQNPHYSGDTSIANLYGQTREFLSRKKK